MPASPRAIALIPARSGSKRIHAKNIRPLAGHPLIAYTIAAATQSGAFDRVVVSTDSEDVARIARDYHAETPFLRPGEMAGDLSPDIEWIVHALTHPATSGADVFALLRPTSPFRQPETIRRAMTAFLAAKGADSLRAVQKVSEHPGKMWVQRGPFITPLLPFSNERQRWQSTPYQALPPVLVQNASLEIAWSRVPLETGTIEGNIVVPFFTEGHEGYDLNDEMDWTLGQLLVEQGRAQLPRVETKRMEVPTHG